MIKHWHPASISYRLILSAIALIISQMAAYPESKPVGPSIHFSGTIFDFGAVMSGDVVQHEFVFTNTGDSSLEVTGVNPSCGCTTVNEWTHSVLPGHTGVVSLKFDSTRFNGPVTETATVMSNDKSRRNLVISFKGTVSKPVEFSPPLVILKPLIDGDASETNTTKIRNHLQEKITIGTPVSDNPAFAAEVKIIIPEREFQLIVHTIPPIHTPILQGTISIQTSSARVPTINIPVIVMTEPQLLLSPTAIQLPSSSLSAATNLTVSLHNRGKKPLSLRDAKIDVTGASVQMKEMRHGFEFSFEIALSSGFTLPRDREVALVISPLDAGIPVITVPLRAPAPAVIANPGPVKPPKVLAAPDNPKG